MWSKLARNCILVGPADAYCLICETHLLDEQATELHINKPVHQKTLDAVGYYEKFKDDLIRKVPCGYYCEACACVSVTAAACSLHVAEPRHRERIQRRLRRLPSGALVCGRRLLSADAWQGLISDTCVLCSADVTDRASHINGGTHILKLVQAQLLFGGNDAIYRKVDSNIYHCLTCNDIFSEDSVIEHFNSTAHLDTLNNCEYKDDVKPTLNGKEVINVKTDDSVKANKKEKVSKNLNEENGKILNAVGRFQKNSVQIDFINEHAYCKKCLVNVEFDFDVIEKHINEHKFKPKKEQTEVNSGANKPQPFVTKPESLKQSGTKVNQPVLTESKKKAKPTLSREAALKKIPFHKFCDEVTLVETSENQYIMIINRFIEFLSYEFVVKSIFDGLSCFICNVSIRDMLDLKRHLTTGTHRERIHDCLVVTSLDSEFVREPNPGVYHCGFCNEIEDDWESMEEHLQNFEHAVNKSKAEEKLKVYHMQRLFMKMCS